MDRIVDEPLRQVYPGYSVERASTCSNIMRIKRKVKTNIKKRVLGIFPVYNYTYQYNDISFNRIYLDIEDFNNQKKEISIAIDDISKIIYWRF